MLTAYSWILSGREVLAAFESIESVGFLHLHRGIKWGCYRGWVVGGGMCLAPCHNNLERL
jgi:hypothetical protein